MLGVVYGPVGGTGSVLFVGLYVLGVVLVLIVVGVGCCVCMWVVVVVGVSMVAGGNPITDAYMGVAMVAYDGLEACVDLLFLTAVSVDLSRGS